MEHDILALTARSDGQRPPCGCVVVLIPQPAERACARLARSWHGQSLDGATIGFLKLRASELATNPDPVAARLPHVPDHPAMPRAVAVEVDRAGAGHVGHYRIISGRGS